MKRVFKILVVLMAILVITTISAIPVLAEDLYGEHELGASIQVDETINATIYDYGTYTGLYWEDALGVDNAWEEGDDQTIHGAVEIIVLPETNVDCDIQVKALDFTGPETITIDHVSYGTDGTPPGTAFAAANTYYTLASYDAPGTGTACPISFWLNLDDGQLAGTYTSTFTFQVVPQSP